MSYLVDSAGNRVSYTPEEEFYGRAIYTALKYGGPWERAGSSLQVLCVEAAQAARAAVYVDPVQEVANRLFVAEYGAMPPDGGKPAGGYLKMARAAIAMGAKP